MTRNDWIEIVGLITNLQEGRFKLTRNEEVWELTPHEQEAIAKLRKAWARGLIEYNG